MHKLYTLLLLLFSLSINLNGQFNMSLLSQVSYNANLSDIWGWADPDTGVEYAIVGVNNGVSIVSLEDPTNATELFFIPGENSTWRDIKTWGDYAYVTTDQGGTTDGLLVIDMSDLPNDIQYYNWNPVFPALGNDELNTCHNIYIDEFGYIYLSGCNLNSGGIIYLDVNNTPYYPEYAGAGLPIYAHDVYTRDNKTYCSEIYAGELSIYDVTDKSETTLLGFTETPYSFTHNAWLSDDGNAVYTTDELANAPVASYDISDFQDIQLLDEYRPLTSVGADVIPHNVHVWNDFLIISYYTDGGRIVDAANPDNLIEVGNFDTFLGGDGGFSGAWGAYPFLPSGNVLLTDIGNGLYVCGADYIRACYLEGVVTDATTTNPIFNVDIQIASTELNEGSTASNGSYKTGLATAGNYDVTFSHPNYISQTINIDLENGELTELDVQLQPKEAIQGIVVDVTTTTITNSHLSLENNTNGEVITYSSNLSGDIQIFAEPGTYTATVGAWGYRTIQEEVTIEQGVPVQFTLLEGYEDDFTFDFDWTKGGSASTGDFERVVPLESTFMNQSTCLGEDLSNDFGDLCYVTGNGGDGGQNDIDDGTVILESPSMDLSNFATATIDYSVYFWVGGGNGGPTNDSLFVTLSNNLETKQVAVYGSSLSDWTTNTLNIEDHISLTNDVRITFASGDSNPGHIVEAMVDGIYVEGTIGTSTTPANITSLDIEIGPNPFINQLNYTCNFEWNEEMNFELIDLNGKTYNMGNLNQSGTLEIPDNIASGNLILIIKDQKTVLHKEELIRVK